MRPVVKLDPGTYTMPDESPITIYKTYNPYRTAKPALVFNLGLFCSYCENAYHQDRDLHVEHVQPKGYVENGVKIYEHLETEWTNFLLSCATCNGPDNKGNENVVLDQCHLPHRNNTFKSLVYKEGGVVIINPSLIGDAFIHAKALIELVGLNKSPIDSRPGDKRWLKRALDWKMAERYKTEISSR